VLGICINGGFMEKDIIIIGGGPAGLTAAIYASRAMLKTTIIEQQSVGGQTVYTTDIENYPGFPDGIMGPELASLMEKQALRFGAELVYESVQKIDIEKKAVVTGSGTHTCKAIILALGASPMKMNIDKEAELTGRGVSYCATCDGAFFRDQIVGVVGGGNTAIEEALFLTNFAKKVYIIHRRDSLRAEKYLQEKAFKHEKIEFIWDSVVSKLIGENELEAVVMKDVKTGVEKQMAMNGLFVFVGYTPRTEIVKGLVELDPNGYIKVDNRGQTSVPWIFAAGDCMAKPHKQVATAVGDGCTAGMSAVAYLEK
jgi:thioredoxin reductase (NADPH)